MSCADLPPHVHVGAGARCADELTGRYLDDQEPRYVSKQAAEFAVRMKELEKVVERPPPPVREPRVILPKPPLAPETLEALGLR